jgi:hypothetical protein
MPARAAQAQSARTPHRSERAAGAALPATAAPVMRHDFGALGIRHDAKPSAGRGAWPAVFPVQCMPSKKKGPGTAKAAKKQLAADKRKRINKLGATATKHRLRFGTMLSRRAKRVYDRMVARARVANPQRYADQRQEVSAAPAAFAGAPPILAAASPFERMQAVATGAPRAFRLNVAGTAVEVDAAPSQKKGRKAGDLRPPTQPALPTTFLDTGANKSYAAMAADPATLPGVQNVGERMLPHLEVMRNSAAGLNVYGKEALFQAGAMPASARFDDAGPNTFMEMAGATRPTALKRSAQMASNVSVFEALQAAPAATSMGAAVGGRPTATAGSLSAAMQQYGAAPSAKRKEKAPVNKQLSRLFRSQMGVDVRSDDDADTGDDDDAKT